MKGTIFDIKRFAVHDGPGIRTTVFSKGCSLNCSWCQNPEGQDLNIDVWYTASRCVSCGRCIEACPEHALFDNDGRVVIERTLCTRCGACVKECPTGAMAFDGREIDSEEVVREVLKDRVFYETSGGGVTISGGDPLVQHEFNLDILRLSREERIHTAIETCLAGSWEILEQFLECTDLFLTDIKIADDDLHRQETGRGNARIKANFEGLVARKADLLVRIPLIPEISATDENLRAIAGYLRETSPETPVELMNFNPLAKSKYEMLKRKFVPAGHDRPFDGDEMTRFRSIFEEEGILVVDGQ
jgi:pyruvate formate lyase activating enzyme